MKKSGFTMIELIFVIVILGVLAAVAIPKLNATRDDAEQAKAMTNLATLMGDLTSYYTAQGTFAENITSMTNVPLKEVKESSKADNYGADVLTTKYYSFEIKNKPCVGFKVNGASLEIASAASVTDNPVCKNILGNTATQNILSGNYKCVVQLEAEADGSGAKWSDYTATDTDAALKKACGTAANEYSTTHTPASQTDKVDIFVPTKIDKAGKKVSVSFEGAGVKF